MGFYNNERFFNSFDNFAITKHFKGRRCKKKVSSYLSGEEMVLLKQWLNQEEQMEIIASSSVLSRNSKGFQQPCFQNGNKMHLKMLCLAKHSNHITNKYEELGNGSFNPSPIPEAFKTIVNRAMMDYHEELKEDWNFESHQILPEIDPDLYIVNLYEKEGWLGVHQDKDEHPTSLAKGSPVVSFSLGDSALFQFGKDRRNMKEIKLESRDVLIFGGRSRMIFHGVSKIFQGTAPPWMKYGTALTNGRLNLTFRQMKVSNTESMVIPNTPPRVLYESKANKKYSQRIPHKQLRGTQKAEDSRPLNASHPHTEQPLKDFRAPVYN